MGTFKGVFLPVLSNIFNVVLFLRVSLIVGEAGIFQSYGILLFGVSTSFLTVLSMNAIVTNGKIRTGGVYYLVSRSLGPATGGTIGILYYLAVTFASSLNIIGAMEAIHVVSGFHLISFGFSMRFFSILLLAGLTAANFVGVRFMRRLGMVLISIVFLSIASILLGTFTSRARSSYLE